ncbi:MAG: hypothetical protein GY928_32265 [Colwellia sp.]|nr:hypothetical protein [Colwellia sp.]
MKYKEIKKWEKIRAKGKFRYIMITGVIKICIPYCIIRTIVSEYVHVREFGHLSNDLFAKFDLTYLLVYSIGGCIIGLFLWKRSEKEYLLK